MTEVNGASFPPIARKERLDRLAALPSRSMSASDLWTQVDNEVQQQLKKLALDVVLRVGGVRASAGRTSGEKFFLFSYMTFIPDSGFDPIVAGISFTPVGSHVSVQADTSGEGTGDWITPMQSRTVRYSRGELLAVAHELAQGLCHCANQIVAALQNQSRTGERDDEPVGG